MKIKRALISVSDKTDLKKLVKALDRIGAEILSTGGTAKFIRSMGVKVTEVSDYTGFPEIMGGRVKTLHPRVHGALLALRNNAEHMAQAKKHGIAPIDMLVVNLYPFAKTISGKNTALETALENIDIGGPAMIRSAAKNFNSVAVLSRPESYGDVIDELEKNSGSLSRKTCFKLARDAFGHTSAYDSLISGYLNGAMGVSSDSAGAVFPRELTLEFEKAQDLRYGENPHQRAALYKDKTGRAFSLAGARQIHGKELSFNNLIDLDAAFNLASEFDEPAACIIKHATPCGAAAAGKLKDAFLLALECDRLSAFGGIVGLNRTVDAETALEIAGAGFIECVISPAYDRKARDILAKKKNIRLIETGVVKKADTGASLDFKRITGGALFQTDDTRSVGKKDIKVVTKKRPAPDELDSLCFAWKVAKHARSNAIVLCRGKKTVGIGAGQTSRIDAAIIAIRKAHGRADGSVLASDGFFPKPDAVEAAAGAGVSSIIQPGGSIADKEIIDTADRLGISMVFTGVRHFKH